MVLATSKKTQDEEGSTNLEQRSKGSALLFCEAGAGAVGHEVPGGDFGV